MQLAFCSVDYLGEALGNPLDRPHSSPALLSEVATEAQKLADDAYERKLPSAIDLTERLLHHIYTRNAFAPPVAEIPSLVWGILMRAKMGSHFREYGGSPPVDVAEMTRQLPLMVEELGAHNHPLIDEVTAPGNQRGLVVYTKNWVGSTYGFTHQLTAISQRCKGEAQKVVLHNLADEFKGVSHDDLRAGFFKKIGVTIDPDRAIEDPDRVSESFGLLNYRTSVALLPCPLRALGSFYAVEQNFPKECMRLLVGLRKLGFEESALQIFTLHAEVDVEHGKEWLEILATLDLSPADCAKVIDGARGQLMARRKMFDAMRTYLARTQPS